MNEHVIYENFVLENQITDLVNTKLDVKSLMTIDTSLEGSAGLKKVINKYTYEGAVEKLAKGAKNTVKGKATFTPEEYTVGRFQQTFEYNDLDTMQDPKLIDVLTNGAATLMANDIKSQYFTELKKISNVHNIGANTALSYDVIVDALAKLDKEVEDNLFILMGNKGKADIRKDDEYKASRQGEILYTGQFGTIAGVPVLFSKLITDDSAVITTKEAVKFFVKKSGTVEQSRDIETKDNTVVYERHGLIALVDDTESIIIKKGE